MPNTQDGRAQSAATGVQLSRQEVSRANIGTTPFNPLHIRDVCHWFDPTSIPLVGGNVQKFAAVSDQATVGYLQQLTPANQLSIAPNGNNGNTCFRSNGSTSPFMSSVNMTNAVLAGKPFYLCAAAKLNTAPSGVHYEIIAAGASGTGIQYSFNVRNSSNQLMVQYFDGTATRLATDTPTVVLGVWHLFEVEYDVQNYQFYTDGVPGATVAKLGDAVYDPKLCMTNSNVNQNSLDGDWGDVIIAKNKLGLSDRSDLRAWMAKKWNIQNVRLV